MQVVVRHLAASIIALAIVSGVVIINTAPRPSLPWWLILAAAAWCEWFIAAIVRASWDRPEMNQSPSNHPAGDDTTTAPER
jgi:hypothetical protein